MASSGTGARHASCCALARSGCADAHTSGGRATIELGAAGAVGGGGGVARALICTRGPQSRLVFSPVAIMKRLARLLLLVAWLSGALTGGYAVDPAPLSERGRVVAQTDWAGLTTTGDRVVLVVGHGDAAWRVAAPVPPFIQRWVRGLEKRGPRSRPPTVMNSVTALLL